MTNAIPTGPIDREPLDYPVPSIYPSTLAKASILRDAFSAAGVELGAYDERIAHWLADTADWSTFAVITSWVQRAGQAGKTGTGTEPNRAGAPVFEVEQSGADSDGWDPDDPHGDVDAYERGDR